MLIFTDKKKLFKKQRCNFACILVGIYDSALGDLHLYECKKILKHVLYNTFHDTREL